MEEFQLATKGFALFGQNRQTLAELKVLNSGDPLLVLNDGKGNGRIDLTVSNGCPCIQLWYAPQPSHVRLRLQLIVGNTGEVIVELVDSDNQSKRRLEIDKLPWVEVGMSG